LIVGRFFNAGMSPKEAILMTGSYDFSKYSGYGNSLRFAGEPAEYRASTILAIDAVNYSHLADPQASKASIDRELEKVRIGLSIPAPGAFATGNWGTGAFLGDHQLKAVIQWLAASVRGKQIRYYPFGDAKIAGLPNFAEQAKARQWTVSQVYNAIISAPPDTINGRGYFQYLLDTLPASAPAPAPAPVPAPAPASVQDAIDILDGWYLQFLSGRIQAPAGATGVLDDAAFVEKCERVIREWPADLYPEAEARIAQKFGADEVGKLEARETLLSTQIKILDAPGVRIKQFFLNGH
jgi:hypothetical protein